MSELNHFINKLSKDVILNDVNNNIYCICYKIHSNITTNDKIISFLLLKKDKLTLPLFTGITKYQYNDKLTDMVESCLFNILNINDEYIQFIDSIEFNGYNSFNNNTYMIYDLTNFEINYNKQFIFCIYDEIIKHNKVNNNIVDCTIIPFFINLVYNSSYIDNSIISETPIICYSFVPSYKVKYVYMFGLSKNNNSNYYQFTNYENIVGTVNNDCVDNKYVIRFALLLGKYKLINQNVINTKGWKKTLDKYTGVYDTIIFNNNINNIMTFYQTRKIHFPMSIEEIK